MRALPHSLGNGAGLRYNTHYHERPTKRPANHHPSRHRLPRHRRKSDRNLALAVVIFLVGVGGTAIALVYGGGAAALGLVCLLAGAGLFGLVWLILTLIGRWAEK